MYEVQASAAVPSMLISKPARFFVLIKSRPKVQTLHTLYSLEDGVSKSQRISVRGAPSAGRVEGCSIDPSR